MGWSVILADFLMVLSVSLIVADILTMPCVGRSVILADFLMVLCVSLIVADFLTMPRVGAVC